MAPSGCIRVELYQHYNFKVFFQKNVSCSIKALQDRHTVSSFLRNKLTTSPVPGKSEISTVKEQSLWPTHALKS